MVKAAKRLYSQLVFRLFRQELIDMAYTVLYAYKLWSYGGSAYRLPSEFICINVRDRPRAVGLRQPVWLRRLLVDQIAQLLRTKYSLTTVPWETPGATTQEKRAHFIEHELIPYLKGK